MAEYRGTLILDAREGAMGDEAIGALLEALKKHDGAVSVEGDARLSASFSFDSGDLPGFASGLVAALPRVVGIARSILVKSDLIERMEIAGIAVERIGILDGKGGGGTHAQPAGP